MIKGELSLLCLVQNKRLLTHLHKISPTSYRFHDFVLLLETNGLSCSFLSSVTSVFDVPLCLRPLFTKVHLYVRYPVESGSPLWSYFEKTFKSVIFRRCIWWLLNLKVENNLGSGSTLDRFTTTSRGRVLLLLTTRNKKIQIINKTKLKILRTFGDWLVIDLYSMLFSPKSIV